MTFANPMFSANQVAAALEKLRCKAPRVHCVTNAVAQAFTANVLLALGAIPSMTVAPREIASFAAGADALLVNLGTLDEERLDAIPLALEAAGKAGKPVVLDPVFVNRSPVRCAFARSLLSSRLSVIRANAEEVASLFPGRDALSDLEEKGVVLAMTGGEDLVRLGARRLRLENGHPLLARVTATGCAGGAVIAAFLGVEDDPLIAAACGISVFNIAAEIAAAQSNGPGSLVPQLLDALYGLTPEQIAARLKQAGSQEEDQ